MRASHIDLNTAHFLVTRTDRLGDMVLSLPLFESIKQTCPQARISVLASSANAAVAQLCPHVDKVLIDSVEARDSGWKGTLGLVRTMRAWRPDVVLFGNAKRRLALAAWLARIPVRIGSARRRYSILYTDRIPLLRGQPSGHEIDRTLRLLEPLDIAPATFTPRVPAGTDTNQEAVASLLHEHDISDDAAVAVVHPTNSGNALNASHRWYATLADALAKEGYRVVLTGTSAEQAHSEAVVTAARSTPVDLTGRLSVAQLIALYARSAACIASSTGTTHLSAAVGARTIGLYAPLEKQDRWLPRGEHVVVLRPDVGMICARCLGTKCGYFNCMEHVSVQAVVAAARKYKV
jgi:ADP-heptose:LPS heptosyltransferase